MMCNKILIVVLFCFISLVVSQDYYNPCYYVDCLQDVECSAPSCGVYYPGDGCCAACCEDPCVNCFVNPCDFYVCGSTDWECVPNYCGGCNRDWFDSDGFHRICENEIVIDVAAPDDDDLESSIFFEVNDDLESSIFFQLDDDETTDMFTYSTADDDMFDDDMDGDDDDNEDDDNGDDDNEDDDNEDDDNGDDGNNNSGFGGDDDSAGDFLKYSAMLVAIIYALI